MSKSLIIIPTYNEIENVYDIIKASLSQDDTFYILIVDDNSPDGTADAVKEIQESEERLHMLQRAGKQGLGTAYIAGFKYALENNYDYVMEMDADFSHNPKDLKRLYSACTHGADIAVGSRYTKGGGIENWGKDRLILSYGASLYVRAITWMPIKDPTAGFICYSIEVLKKLDLDKVTQKGYGFQIEMKYASRLNGFKIKEVPITFTDRIKGISKMDSSIITEAIWGVIKMRWRGFVGYYRY